MQKDEVEALIREMVPNLISKERVAAALGQALRADTQGIKEAVVRDSGARQEIADAIRAHNDSRPHGGP
jgi:hypothetical protein